MAMTQTHCFKGWSAYFYLLPHKGFHDFFLRFSYQDTENYVKLLYVRVCVKILENSSSCISKITRPIEVKLGVHLKKMRSLRWYNFRSNWFVDWDFKIWIFWKMSVIALAAANINRSSLTVYYKEITVEGRLRLNLGKIHRNFQILWNFE